MAVADTVTAAFGPITIDPLANDAPGDGAPLDRSTLRLTLQGLPHAASLSADGRTLIVPGEGRYVVNADATILFTPETGFSGAATPVTYTVQDADGNAISATISVIMSAAPIDPAFPWLPATGGDPTGPLGIAAALLLLGLAVLVVSRWRRRNSVRPRS